MSQVSEIDLKRLVLSNTAFGPDEIQTIIETIATDFSNYRRLREAAAELELAELSPSLRVRLGVCYYLMGRYERALETLSASDGGAVAQFYMARSLFGLERYDEAIHGYDTAAKAGYPADKCALARAEALRYRGDATAALAVLDQLFGPVEQTADYLYQRGATVASLGGNPSEAIALLERAVEIAPTHPGALFALAVENDRRGNDDTALQLYERSASRFPPHMGTLLNLGILYEDRHRYDHARRCYQRILDVYPNHARARLFLKDASASSEMLYDEDAQRKRDRLSQILNVPVTDFELSVRSRNCLQKMGIMTLGDLTSITEQELLASKNFGETSLIEIREMMITKGLELGQFAGTLPKAEFDLSPESLTPDEQILLSRPIADLSLSVRARKCMVRLGISTIAELIRKTGDELLECKNFGVTSLNEVRERLAANGLRLRGD